MPRQEKSDKKTNFSKNLEFLRASHGFSQRDLANAVGLSQAAVSMWLTGETSPKSGELEKLASFFAVSMDDLWRGDITKPGSAPKDEWRARAQKAETKIKKLIPTCKKLAEGIGFLSDILDE